MNLTANSAVTADGDQVGRLSGVVVDALTNQVAGLMVRDLHDAGHLVVVPADAVTSAEEGDIRLGMSAAEYARLSPATTARHGRTAAAGHATRRQAVRIEIPFDTPVFCLDGPLGPLRRVLYDEYSFAIEELVIGASDHLNHEAGVPVDWVRELRQGRIVLSCERREVASMPLPREDM